jgi:membrane protease subunit HflK
LLYLPLDKLMQSVAQGGAVDTTAAAVTPPAAAPTALPSSDTRTRDGQRSRDRDIR